MFQGEAKRVLPATDTSRIRGRSRFRHEAASRRYLEGKHERLMHCRQHRPPLAELTNPLAHPAELFRRQCRRCRDLATIYEQLEVCAELVRVHRWCSSDALAIEHPYEVLDQNRLVRQCTA